MGHQIDDRQSVESAFYNFRSHSCVATIADSNDSNSRVQYSHCCGPSLTHYITSTLVFSHSLTEVQETDMNGLILFMPIISWLSVAVKYKYKCNIFCQ